MFPTFPMPSSPKYPCAWWCISSIWICYTCLKMFLGPVPASTMNTRRTKPYLLVILITLSIMSLEFETDISNLSASLYISFFLLKINFETLWISRIHDPLKLAKNIVHNWSIHLNVLIDGYVAEKIYEYLCLTYLHDYSGYVKC